MPVLLTRQPDMADPTAAATHALPQLLRSVDRALARALQHLIAPAGIRLVLWTGDAPFPPRAPVVGDLIVRTRSALARLILDPDLYFGEAFMAGAIEVRGDLVAFLEA